MESVSSTLDTIWRDTKNCPKKERTRDLKRADGFTNYYSYLFIVK
jgi:hypothetical protein